MVETSVGAGIAMELKKAEEIIGNLLDEDFNPNLKAHRKAIEIYCEPRLERMGKHTSPSFCDKFTLDELKAAFRIKQEMSNSRNIYGKKHKLKDYE